ncbi:hypothetical protein D3C72_2163780 [compost metagenome]
MAWKKWVPLRAWAPVARGVGGKSPLTLERLRLRFAQGCGLQACPVRDQAVRIIGSVSALWVLAVEIPWRGPI